MGKVLKVLGIEFSCSYADELMEMIKRQRNEDGLFTYAVISRKLLMEATDDAALHQFVDILDGSIIGETEVLRASNLEDEKLIQDVESYNFPRSLLMFLVEYQYPVFLLGETAEEAQGFADYLKEMHVDFPVTGVDYLDVSNQDNVDRVINEINTHLPAMVLAFGQNLSLEHFVLEYRKRMNTKFWVSLGGFTRLAEELGAKPTGWLMKLLEKAEFRKMVNKYNSENGGSSL